MNVIQIVADTLRRDFLGCYGNEWIHTEHIDDFARKSLVFDKAYIASFPTIPHRHDLFTGRYTFTYSVWAPLPTDEVIVSQLLRQAGYTTMLVVDNYHMIENGHYFDRGFDGWLWIRGQEFDRYMTHPTSDCMERRMALGTRYLRNVSSRRFEQDYFVAQSINAAVKWLELNYDQHEKFFLHIDTFDPHEPWDPPEWYADMYDPDWKGGEVPPTGGAYVEGQRRPAVKDLTEDDVNHLRALYAGEVTLVDRRVGTLLQKTEDLGLLENTAIIFTTDHGTYIGEHGYIGKGPHLYEEVTHIPLIIRLPDYIGSKHERSDALVQPPDLMPTILELAGVQPPGTIQGKPLVPVIRGEESQTREIAVSADAQRRVLRRGRYRMYVTSKDWSLITVKADAPETDDWTGKRLEPELYNLTTDPKQTHNLFNEKKEVAEELRSRMVQFLESLGTREDLVYSKESIKIY